MGIGDTFSAIFGNIRYQYFCQQAMPLRQLHNDARGTTSRVSARAHAVTPWCTVQGDVNYMRWTHVLGSADERIGVKTLTKDSETFALKPTTSYSPADTPRSCSAGDSPPPPHATELLLSTVDRDSLTSSRSCFLHPIQTVLFSKARNIILEMEFFLQF